MLLIFLIAGVDAGRLLHQAQLEDVGDLLVRPALR
jgi:hypothetical protein